MSKVHALASYGLLNYPEIGGDYARTGIALYGVLSCASHAVPRAAALQPVLSLKTRVAQVQMLQPGERAGYDLRFTARRETRLAVLSIGYADGLPRSLSCGVGAVLLHGCRAPSWAASVWIRLWWTPRRSLRLHLATRRC